MAPLGAAPVHHDRNRHAGHGDEARKNRGTDLEASGLSQTSLSVCLLRWVLALGGASRSERSRSHSIVATCLPLRHPSPCITQCLSPSSSSSPWSRCMSSSRHRAGTCPVLRSPCCCSPASSSRRLVHFRPSPGVGGEAAGSPRRVDIVPAGAAVSVCLWAGRGPALQSAQVQAQEPLAPAARVTLERGAFPDLQSAPPSARSALQPLSLPISTPPSFSHKRSRLSHRRSRFSHRRSRFSIGSTRIYARLQSLSS